MVVPAKVVADIIESIAPVSLRFGRRQSRANCGFRYVARLRDDKRMGQESDIDLVPTAGRGAAAVEAGRHQNDRGRRRLRAMGTAADCGDDMFAALILAGLWPRLKAQ